MKLGLCCISEILKEKGKQSFRTITRKRALTYTRDELEIVLEELILHNLEITKQIVFHCADIGISHYRLSSSLFPIIGEKTLGFSVSWLDSRPKIIKSLKELGGIIKACGLTVSSHPGQYTVLPSVNPTVVENAIVDLNLHGWLHDRIDQPRDYSNPINIHIGFSGDSPENIHKRFMEGFNRLDDSVKSRLVLENEDKGIWNCETIFKFFGNVFPLTYDNLHEKTNPSNLIDPITKFISTWKNFQPVFHWSEGIDETSRSHTQYFSHIPSYIKETLCVWECEVKAKDKAIIQIL